MNLAPPTLRTAAFAVLALAGCNTTLAVIDGDAGRSACASVTCNGHGRCATIDGTAACVCDPGYDAIGTSCVADGTDAGAIDAAGGARDGGMGASGGCRLAVDCPGALCDYASGACVPQNADRCVLPPAEGGSAEVGRGCGISVMSDGSRAPLLCGPGLTCVPRVRRYDVVSGEYVLDLEAPTGIPLPGRCEPACDPCAGCDEGECVALPEGGFCARGGLLGEGEVCSTVAGVVGECAGAMACPPSFTDFMSRCSRTCRPDDRAYAAVDEFRSVSTSADCEDGSVCRLAEASIDGHVFLCAPSTVVPVGAACGFSTSNSCAYPDVCANQQVTFGGGPVNVPGVCSPVLTSCEGTSCPSGTHCRSINLGFATSHVCVGERSLPRTAACADDLDCATSLRCAPVRSSSVTVCQ